MSHRLIILRRAQSQLRSLPSDGYERCKRAISDLAANPRPAGCLELKGRDGWRLRVGRYRVVYEIDDKTTTVTIMDIDHRKDIYR